eukprot:scaffold20226_cov85-Skeletonema_dohrnii-CCMP3373.AAC.3
MLQWGKDQDGTCRMKVFHRVNEGDGKIGEATAIFSQKGRTSRMRSASHSHFGERSRELESEKLRGESSTSCIWLCSAQTDLFVQPSNW